MAKQTRKSFPAHTSFSAKKVLELVDGDLCGPISPETPGGNKYFFLLVDDYSRFMWVYMLKRKDEALKAFKIFKAQVEGKVEEKLKVLEPTGVANSVQEIFYRTVKNMEFQDTTQPRNPLNKMVSLS